METQSFNSVGQPEFMGSLWYDLDPHLRPEESDRVFSFVFHMFVYSKIVNEKCQRAQKDVPIRFVLVRVR